MISIRKKMAPVPKTGWLRFSQKVDGGLLLLVELARKVSGTPLSLRTVAEKNGVSFFFLQKIAADLRKAGIVRSGRGKNGGYELAKPAEEVTMKEILEAHEGPLSLMYCLDHQNSCVRENWCTVRPGINFINQTIVHTLAKTTLADFISPTSPWKTS